MGTSVKMMILVKNTVFLKNHYGVDSRQSLKIKEHGLLKMDFIVQHSFLIYLFLAYLSFDVKLRLNKFVYLKS